MLKDVRGKDGFLHRYWLPDDSTLPAEQGIEQSLDFSELAEDFGFPATFAKALQSALWEQGIITAKDYFKDDIHAIVGSAMRRLIKVEANQLVDYVRRHDHALE